MRVVSLLPAATEIVAALGGAAWLVGISHACDYPPEVLTLPRLTGTTAGRAPLTLDVETLDRLAPDLIVSQSVCDVCAVGESAVAAALAGMTTQPRVVTLHAHRLEEVFADVLRVGEALGLESEADELVAGLRYRLRRIRQAHSPLTTRPRTVVLEWLDPPFVAGHWVPELVAAAGGVDVGARPGERSMKRSWADLRGLAPEVVVIALCGVDVPRAERESAAVTDSEALALFRASRVAFLDGNAYTSRPGPRLVDGAERLRRLIHG